ncbi:MAG: DMT family transporter [Clostridia bacterium]|nr:DMT family transporter [Clostridia bacterium]
MFQTKRGVTLIAIVYTFLWGCAFPLVKICMSEFGAVDNMSKCLVAGFRFTLSGLALSLFATFLQKKENTYRPAKKDILPILSYGVLGTALQYALTYIGLSHVEASKGAIFDQMCVFIIIIVSGLFMKNDKLTLLKIVGTAVGLLGILASSTEKMSLTFTMKGEGVMVLVAFVQAGAYFVAALFANKIPSIFLVGYGQLSGGVLLILFSLLAGGRVHIITPTGILTLLALAAIAGVAYVLSLIPLRYFPASEVSVFNLLITVFGVVMGGVILNENILRIEYLISLLLVSLGIFLVNYRGHKHGKNL